MSHFAPAKFKLTVRHASGPLPRLVEGWSDGTFGLDKRRCWTNSGDYRLGYVVTHLRTGFAIFGVIGSRKITESIVKTLHAANWDFGAPDQVGHDCKVAAQAARDAHESSVVAASEFDPAACIDTEASAIEARSDATVKQGAAEGESAVPKADAQPPVHKKEDK